MAKLKSQGLKVEPERDPKAIEDEVLAEEKKKLHEKVRSYARNVKEMYWPKVSEEKR